MFRRFVQSFKHRVPSAGGNQKGMMIAVQKGLATFFPHSFKDRLKKSGLIEMKGRIERRFQYMSGWKGINIEVTGRCNLKCVMCPFSKRGKTKKKDMKFGLFKEIVQKAAEIPIVSLSLSGFGEPLLWPYLEDGIRYIKSLRSDILVVFNTNGVLLSGDWADRLIAAGLDHLCISINGANRQTYADVQGVDSWDRAVSGTTAFLQRRNNSPLFWKTRHPDVRIQVLETDEIVPLVPAFRAIWKQYVTPADDIYVKPVCDWGGTVATKYYKEVLSRPSRFPCPLLWIKLAIDVDGWIYICDNGLVLNDGENDLRICHISECSLKQIDQHPSLIVIRQRHFQEDWIGTSCEKCSDWFLRGNMFFKLPLPLSRRKWY